MARHSNYDKFPCVPVSSSASQCWVGWQEIIGRLKPAMFQQRCVICVECYPGVFENQISQTLKEGLRPAETIYTPGLLKPANCIDNMLVDVLSDDPVFGRMNDIELQAFFDEPKLQAARDKANGWKSGLLLIVGVGAALVSPNPEILIYADMARWEIQRRQRSGAPNWRSALYY